MPVLIFSTFPDLAAHIATEIGPNGMQDIDGQKHQDILLTTAASLVNILLSLPPDTVSGFEAWDSGELYEGGSETIVSHSGKLWLFVKATDDTGTTPGTNITVWREISAIELAHFRNGDVYLDFGGGYQVSAQQLFEHINNAALHAGGTSWKEPVKSRLSTPPVSPANGDGHLILTPASGAWSGWSDIARRVGSTWVNEVAANGSIVYSEENPDSLWMKQAGVWALVPIGAGTMQNITHNAAGTLTLDCKRRGFNILATADVTFNYNATGAALGGALWTVDIQNGSGSTINLNWTGGQWSVIAAIDALGYPPATMSAGQRLSFSFRCYPGSSQMVITEFLFGTAPL